MSCVQCEPVGEGKCFCCLHCGREDGRMAPTADDREALDKTLSALRSMGRIELQEFSTRLTMLAGHLHSEHEEDALITHQLARLLYVLAHEGWHTDA